jgi:ABC-type branched-subunit amino acid transport system substrate-binding protein
MRFLLLSLFVALFFASAYAVKQQQKAVIITYDQDTPDHEVNKAIEALKEAGGVITHEYSMFDLCYEDF